MGVGFHYVGYGEVVLGDEGEEVVGGGGFEEASCGVEVED